MFSSCLHLDLDYGHIRDPSGGSIPVRNLRITMQDVNSRPPQPTLARKFLNESVSLSCNERNTTLQIGNQSIDIPISIPWFEAWRETFLQVQFPSDHEFTKHYIACVLVAASTEGNPAELLQHMSQQLQQLQNLTPAKLPKWFSPGVMRYYVLVHDTIDGDSAKAEAAFSAIKNMYGEIACHFLQINSRVAGYGDDHSHLPDPWSQFLLRHIDNQDSSDHDSSPRTPAEMGGITVMPSRLITEGHSDGETVMDGGVTVRSGAVMMSSLELAQEAGENSPVPVTHHPLSPDAGPNNVLLDKACPTTNDFYSAPSHVNFNVWAGQSAQLNHAQSSLQHGACLTTSDLEHLRTFVQEFCIKALLPYVENQIQQLSDLISNKKGVSRSLFSATKRWFGSNKPGLPGSNTATNAVIYSCDAPELQLRRLGDLCFMFGHYSLAFQAYHTAKRDFNADQAWLYYAGALEMAALSAFMQGEVTRKAQEYMEESIVTYLSSCKMPQFATRATLLSTECLKGRNLYGEAAKQFIRMTSEDSDLRSALLLEQASYCFLKSSRPRMIRKYAFHIVLAGHRFSKAGQRKHSLRCYRQALQVFENKSWGLAEDHIHFTIGRLAMNLKQVSEAAVSFSRLLNPSSSQNGPQQAAFLREFLTSHMQLITEDNSNSSTLPTLPLPLIDSNAISVLIGALSSHPPTDQSSSSVPATGVTFSDAQADNTRWFKLEEQLIAEAQGTLPMIFKPTIQLFSKHTNNVIKPLAVINEPVNVCVQLQNPFHISISLRDVRLLWNFKHPDDAPISNETRTNATDTLVTTQCLESVVLRPNCTEEVILCLTPHAVGGLNITGIAYSIANPIPPPPSDGSQAPASGNLLVVPGKQVFTIKSLLVKQPKDKTPQDVLDRRLELNIVPHAPCLQVTFHNLPAEMLCGELQRVTLEFTNIGSAPLTRLYIGCTSPELFFIEGMGSGAQQITGIPLPSDQFAPGRRHSVAMWLRAPDNKGSANLEMHRLVRHSCDLSVLGSIQLSVNAVRSRAITDGTTNQEFLNLTLVIKNSNQVHDPVLTEISPLQLSLASNTWKLTEKVVIPNAIETISDLPLSKTTVIKEQSISVSPYHDFYQRHLRFNDVQNRLADTSGDMEAALRMGAMLILRWQSTIKNNGSNGRTVIGQHHVAIDKLDVSATWPPESSPALQMQEQQGPLYIFGPDVISSATSAMSDKYPSLDVLQRLVTYSIHHPPSIAHDFKHSRLCVVPVRLHLQNCSDSHLVIKVTTVGNSSSSSLTNKNQLYSPHSSGCFRWVGLACSNLELSPHTSESVCLSAAFGSPGTFNLGTRLEVWCRSRGAPEADSVTQSWRVESSLIVCSTS
uniref:Trafficking protein particle complex subunit 8 n=1 Tax=Timema tahoe TaxID=61484 RepID=A0A7R9FK38_9NEOP|nr:unnamed protein product [Timema tahoe]